ncbi:MAG: hypothetical protein C4330_02675 [Chitinophagaceae bacterium]
MLKYDWYDPNTKVNGTQIANGSNLTAADIKFSTVAFGVTHYITPALKILAYYDVIKNESTGMDGFKTDVQDNVFTLRMQLRF